MYELHVYPTKAYNRSAEYRRRFRDRLDALTVAARLLRPGNRKAKLYAYEKTRPHWRRRTKRRLILTATEPGECYARLETRR